MDYTTQSGIIRRVYMHLAKVKNGLIVILLFADILLLGLFAYRQIYTMQVDLKAQRQLILLLEKQGISVKSIPSENLRYPQFIIQRNQDVESKLVSLLINNSETRDLGGGIYTYESEDGTAQFRGGGRFEISLNNITLDVNNVATECRDLLLKMGFNSLTNDYMLDNLENGDSQLIFGQTLDNHPIYNAKITATTDKLGKSVKLSGLWMLSDPQIENDKLCKSASTVLMNFAASSDNKYKILDIQLGFRLKTLTPTISVLAPEWRLICQDKEYYIDAFTGEETTDLMKLADAQ